MSTQNVIINILETDSISSTTTSDSQNVLAYDALNVIWNVSLGSADPNHKLSIQVQTCDKDSTDDNDWADMVPESGALNDVRGTGGTNEWPVTQVARFREMSKYVRAKLTITGGGTWTTSVSGAGKIVN